jgi:hypothetical protein
LPTPSPSAALTLSKEAAYLSGDTVAVTVTDSDRNTDASVEDALATAIRVFGVSYYSGDDLLLDLHEDGVNSGTFLATIRTGTETAGGAGLSAKSNIGTIKTVHNGTATVMYTDTTPDAATIAKTLAFCHFDATLEFDAESYTIGDYAVILHGDAEENKDCEEVEVLLDHAIAETSSLNRVKVRLVETGVDTGSFRGSIQISADASLDYERIQSSPGETLTVSCTDAVNTSGYPREVTAVCRVVGAATPTPTPSPEVTPTPVPECMTKLMTLSHRKLELRVNRKRNVTVTLRGDNGCAVEGEEVMVWMNNGGSKCVSISPAGAVTNAEGNASFIVKGRKKGKGKIMFGAGDVKRRLEVKVVE